MGRDSVEPYYSSPARQATLIAEARAWLGTPFAPHAAIRGAGVDCVHLWGSIYIATGALEVFNPPKYKLDGGAHSGFSLVIEYLDRCGAFLPLRLDRGEGRGEVSKLLPMLLPGDLLIFKLTGVAWHVGGFLGGVNQMFLHCMERRGVIEDSLLDHKWSRRLAGVYRPVGRDSVEPSKGSEA